MKKKVAIIGSGIAGLALASLLKTSSNFEFVVYEKGDNLNLEEGFGLQLSVNSVSILNKICFILLFQHKPQETQLATLSNCSGQIIGL